ncbi:hypothetical protein COU17_03410 [Candidatus Kaiserbacteria bacterium CG10_big_fil_rev_8_21_14_0_10_49_17]|uniref:Uncharacterized protein n=1 Tax=Candidatus Kaiserbacteria bacterium CG10_big_fil_rev_8_21_14_0_10_49_17 TaxID=1974609 RepID=A0A2M6WDK6_9BACT|nr:MAG: hypothetical protein COU17_03410 [Candidatus Kaiserbacteria bacterium CG10_big_fil_rev_8_21_14_0_10_49_17]
MEKIVVNILDPIAYLLFAVALFFFMWGLTVFIWKADQDEGRTTGKRHMLWGIVGMFIIVSVQGIIYFIRATVFSL